MKIEELEKNAIAAFDEASDENKKLLMNLFGKNKFKPKKIVERVKTFEDACAIVQPGENLKILLDYDGDDGDLLSSQAHLKIAIIAKALNEGWQPDWTNSIEYKYVPWFKHKSSFGLSYYDCAYWFTDAIVGSRLCFRTKELAEYAATQFTDIYNTFLTIKS
jgi:hypothetical protein